MLTVDQLRHMSRSREVLTAVAPLVHGDAIDLGAGLGRYRSLFADQAQSFVTLDIQDLPGVDIVADVLNPPVEDASFDTVISTAVLEHVREPWVMLEHVARMLRPGGTVILMAPFMCVYHSDPHHYYNYSVDGLRYLCERVGLEVELCGKYGGVWSIVKEWMKQSFLSPYEKPHPWWRRRLVSFLEPCFLFLNRFFPPHRAYANVLCIARKPSSSGHADSAAER